MASGRLVEAGTPEQIFASPTDPRTAKFLQSVVHPQ
jgi:ABC-type histidine transport system ATPase subunit